MSIIEKLIIKINFMCLTNSKKGKRVCLVQDIFLDIPFFMLTLTLNLQAAIAVAIIIFTYF